MKYSELFIASAIAAVLLGPVAGFADLVRLPPSVGATPIEIPGQGRVSATPIEIPGQGRVSATPIEIPGIGPRSATPIEIPRIAITTLPPVLPGGGLANLDPARSRGAFSVLPVPLPDPAHVGRIDRFSYATLHDGTIYGDTNFGYAHFASMNDYQTFLRSH